MLVRNALALLIALGGFGILHSLLAGKGLKPWLKSWLGERTVEGWYRLGYNAVAALTLLPAAAVYLLLPDRQLYVVEMPWALIIRVLQIVALLGIAGALLTTDLWRFLGVRQAAAHLAGEPLPLPDEPLQVSGMYRFVRHPLYFFSLILIWAMPRMTLNLLLVNIALTLYILVGSIVEERRLLRRFGSAYRDYQGRVSWLLPLPPRLGQRAGEESSSANAHIQG